MTARTVAWHVTPTENMPSIWKHGLIANQPEPDGDLAVSFFITKEDAMIETKKWLSKKWDDKPLTILTVNIDGVDVTETFPYEVITTSLDVVSPDRILSVESLVFSG